MREKETEDDQVGATRLVLYSGLSLYLLPIALLLAVLLVLEDIAFFPFTVLGLVIFFHPNRPVSLVSYAEHRALRVPTTGGSKEWSCDDIVRLAYVPGTLRGTAKLRLVLANGSAVYLPGSSGRILRKAPSELSHFEVANAGRTVFAGTAKYLSTIQAFTGRPLETSEALWWPPSERTK